MRFLGSGLLFSATLIALSEGRSVQGPVSSPSVPETSAPTVPEVSQTEVVNAPSLSLADHPTGESPVAYNTVEISRVSTFDGAFGEPMEARTEGDTLKQTGICWRNFDDCTWGYHCQIPPRGIMGSCVLQQLLEGQQFMQQQMIQVQQTQQLQQQQMDALGAQQQQTATDGGPIHQQQQQTPEQQQQQQRMN
uniref:CBM1 domain-containing protein n=1 Tax=Chromera velia CCMP2878 TaxID=1169474 RepID=A0A0G4GRF1_9ALVE|eukprot:Cvel_23041.t1-p1 / transcript=Cvel_23041.t1 / gene=Cvel_23041 / organism=Chromera_velia_CCMP2878 / gene_product=hypothetical protein / transcript_product=hypothetical protein / location=Cvel_scaffold2330:354-2298(-) / protein_length=191 / sequence_SO=supercontig / SO=protein_coding / is_pseudo=false